MTDILLEKKLTTDFTMGFELEAIWLADETDDDNEYNSYSDYEDEINDLFNSEFPGGDLHGDGSVHGWGDGVGFEWASPVLPFNVASLQKIINFYRKHLGKEFIVNDSCGYHHHISFSGISAEDVVWIMCKLATDNRMRNLISNFEGIEFVSGWSEDSYLDDLADAVHDLNYSRIVELCNTRKYSLLNVHSNKTLEWRGPRGFLNKQDTDIIIKFYKRLHQFITWITDVLDEKEIEGISKENFDDMIRAALPNDKRISDFYATKKKEKGELSPETLSKLTNTIIRDGDANIFKFIKQPKLIEQVIQLLYNKNRLGFIVKRLNENPETNQGNLLLLNNICWKYIPYRVGLDYMDTISGDTIANSSRLTMDRLWATSRKDGAEVSYSDKFNVLNKALAKIPTANIIKPDNAPKLYEATADWSNGFETIVIIAKNGWLDSISDINRCFQTCSLKLMEDDNQQALETMADIFKGKINFADYFAVYSKLFSFFLEKYIDEIKTLAADEIENLVRIAKDNGKGERMVNLLRKNEVISEEESVKLMAKLTNASIDNINNLVQ